MTRTNEKGQVLLVVVLVMIVSLTIGLSVVSRSVVNLRTSTEEVNSLNALSAAESGIEKAVQLNSNTSGTFAGGATFTSTVLEIRGSSLLVAGGNLILPGDGVDVWLVPHNTDGTPNYSTPWPTGNLDIHWGISSTACDNAAIEVALITGSRAAPQLARYAFDACAARRTSNNFSQNVTAGNFDIAGKRFFYKVVINSISNGLLARVVPIYRSTPIGIVGSQDLPSQGFVVESTGKSLTTQRNIVFFKAYEQIAPQYFLYGLFSP